MKKLSVFEGANYGDKYMSDFATAKIDHADVVATWKWHENLDISACSSFFNCFRDVIMKLDAPFTACGEAARLFLLGCSFGHALSETDNPYEVDILDIKS